MQHRPKILVVSLTDISIDARVLREISVVEKFGETTTLGYGPKPMYGDEHLQLPDSAKSLPQTPEGVIDLALHRFVAAAKATPAFKEAMKLLAGRRFDAVIANDARALPVAFAASHGAPVWGDMHEYAPEERTHVASWRILVKPLMDFYCRTFLQECQETSTVSAQFAGLYWDNYGVDCNVIWNASPYVPLKPSVPDPNGKIRLVHAGGAVYGRNIENMMKAVAQLGDPFTLDLYLVPGNDGGKYLSQLKQAGKDYSNVTIHPSVPPKELSATLNQYDIGIHWLPPYNDNAIYTLPNKIFDYTQARLGVAIGPTMAMADIVHQYDLGLVSDGFEYDDIEGTIAQLNADNVQAFKEAADRAAYDLSFDQQAKVIEGIMSRLLGGAELSTAE
ncbi:MAG: hypothetical protein SPI12_00500 [Actinomycetaceae bacterium]|nr:hypothetical protein [Actinomycetaceae bacterium]MDY6082332.1 hypothetical protein [Actinomycetaceae bacterium]